MPEKLEIAEIIERIRKQKHFDAIAEDKSFHIKVNRYVPYCCTAIHDGSNLRKELKGKIQIDDYGRWYEEDPHTGKFISSLPITIIGLDSRFEYDLNRRPEECIYQEAWGQKVWNRSLSAKDRKISLEKHKNFYLVLQELVEKLEELYNGCIVYDMHSYNHQRWERDVPLFNIGTEKIDVQKYGDVIENWTSELKNIDVVGVDNITAINDVFYGRGYNLEFITTNFSNTLVLAVEIKKIFSNELTGEDYPKIIRELQQKLKNSIINNAHFFAQQHTNWKWNKSTHLLDRKTDPAILSVDKKLFKLLRGFELLAYVNPSNTIAEQKRFTRNKFTEPPKFKYTPIKIYPYELKQELSSIKIQNISDVSIRYLYESVINSYFDKIDMLSSLGTKKFQYNSLRYFGRPSKKDLINANYLLHLPTIPTEPVREPHLSIDEIVELFKRGIEAYGINCKISTSKKVISQVMILNSKKTILIRPDAKITRKEANALIEHEIGVHMVTTQNSSDGKLKVFNLGLPVNTLTQEGLAILSEYLSGNISLNRLKKIALRVVVTDMMCNGADFMDCFNLLTQQYNLSVNDAFTMTTRVYRGGGFTKDYLYLSGFGKVLELWNSDTDLSPLLVGKTSLEFYDTITELIDRDLIDEPSFYTKSFLNPNEIANSEIYEYIISGIQ